MTLDEKINAGIPAYEAALKEAGIEYQIYMYEGAKHAFHNDAIHQQAASVKSIEHRATLSMTSPGATPLVQGVKAGVIPHEPGDSGDNPFGSFRAPAKKG